MNPSLGGTVRQILTTVISGALVAVGLTLAPPAAADTTMASTPTVKLTAPYAQASTDAIVKVKLTQTAYKNISLDIAFSGFRAHHEVAYAKGTCPDSVARITLPAKVTVIECGWSQEGDSAVLRLALQGPLTKDTVKVRVKSNVLIAPDVAGVYGVFVSSWAFDEVSTTTEISSGPVK